MKLSEKMPQLPDSVLEILDTLEQRGFAAYPVGGCVRDSLLGRPVHDWDITTAARPEQVAEIFPHCAPTGLRHGTVTVILPFFTAEVTTFRSEGTYSDGRRPDSVTYVDSLYDDLARRDFTVNAMALRRDGSIVDCFGGLEDLQNGILRCVGSPEQRFSEDALRMLRAFRFSAQLDFTIEPETLAGVRTQSFRAERLSAERVRDEVEKTLFSARPARLQTMQDLGLLKAVEFPPVCIPPEFSRLDSSLRWCALQKLLPDYPLRKLRLPKRITREAAAVAGIEANADTDADWKSLLNRCGRETVLKFCALQSAETLARVERILESGEAVFLKDLAVTGRDFPHLGGATGAVLQRLLEHVHRCPEDNQKEILLRLAEQDISGSVNHADNTADAEATA